MNHPRLPNPLSALTLALSLAISAPGLAVAATGLYEFNITAQPLNQALQQVAAQADMALLVDAKLTDNLNATPLSGQLTVRDALWQLLQPNGLTATISDGSIIIKAAPTAAQATELSALKVQGSHSAPGMFDEEQIDPIDLPYVKTRSVVHVTQENIERFRGTSPADMLQGTAGVQVADARNSGALDVNIRGLQGQGRVPVLIDGSSQSQTVYRGYSGVADRSYVDPDLISSINIEKGASLSAQGTGAIGGLVNMTTLKADDIVLKGQRTGVRLRGGLQSNTSTPPDDVVVTPRTDSPSINGDAGFASVALATKQENYDLLAAYSYRTQGNYYAGKKGHSDYVTDDAWWGERGVAKIFKPGEEVLNTSNESRSALLKATLRPTDNQALTLAYRNYRSTYGEIMSSQIMRARADTIPQWPLSNVKSDSYTANYRWSPDNPLWDVKANLWYTDTDSETYNSSVFHTPRQQIADPEWAWDNSRKEWIQYEYRSDTQAQRLGFDISNTSKLDTRAGAMKLNYGLSWQQEYIGPGDDIVITQTHIDNNKYLRDGDRQEASAFASLEWAIQPWLTLDVGGRYTYFNTQDNNVRSEQRVNPNGWKNLFLFNNENYRIGTVRWDQDENGEYTDATNPILNGGEYLSDPVWDENGNMIPSQLTPIVAANISRYLETDTYFDPIPGEYDYIPGISREDHGFAPIIGLSAQVNDSTIVYARYSEALRMPSLAESTMGFSAAVSDTLKPEHSKDWEIGVNWLTNSLIADSDNMRLKFAYFDDVTEDYIGRRPHTNATNNISSMVIDNQDSYRRSGLELQSQYDSSYFFSELSAAYYHHVELCDSTTANYIRDNTRLKGVPDCTGAGFSTAYTRNHVPPKYAASLILGAKLPTPDLSTGVRVTYNGEPAVQQVIDGSAPWEGYFGSADQILTRAYTLLDVFATYTVNPHLTLDLAVDNITDQYYLDPLTQSLMPAPGRTFRFSISSQF